MKSEFFPKGFPSFLKKYKTISSTNDAAIDFLVEKGKESNGAVFIAEYQEKGRGRLGRSWFAIAGQNLLMSFVFVPPESCILNLIPLAAGLSCVKAIRKYRNLEARIKWPNDIIFGNKKMGGILTESRTMGSEILGIVVGIGLNVKGGKNNFPKELSNFATTMEQASEQECSVEEFFEVLLEEIPVSLESFFINSKLFIKEVEGLLIHKKGDEIAISFGDECLVGKYEGLSENGEIVLNSQSGLKTFSCGEIVKMRNAG